MVDVRRKPRCRWMLRFGGVVYCRETWRHDIMAEAKRLHFGCPSDCPMYEALYPTIWDDETPGVEPGKQQG